MIILSNFILSCARVLDILLTFLSLLIVIRALISWVNPDPYNPIVQFLHRTTDPILEPIRRLLPQMAIDISPLIVFIIIIFLQGFLVNTLRDLGHRMHRNETSIFSQMNLTPPPSAVKFVRLKGQGSYV